jgi:hypothetical protein
MSLSKQFRWHMRMMTCVLLVGLIVAVTPPSTAEAAIGGCRSDPIVVLSDGTILDVSAEIGTDVSKVTDIHYVVHGPRGVQLVAAISTPTLGFTGKESFTYYDDAQPNEYITETLVRTVNDQIGVIAHTTFAKATIALSSPLSLQYKPIKGFNNQTLRAVLKR